MLDAVIRCVYGFAAAAAMCTAASNAAAWSVAWTHAGVPLGAALELAAGRTPADGAAVMVHGTMAHRDMDELRHLRRLLQEKGHSTLSIDPSLGRDRPEGMFDCAWPNTHRAEDALVALGPWLDSLKREGAGRTTLLGFSRGGQQAEWFAAQSPPGALDAVVLLAPIVAGGDEVVPDLDKRIAPATDGKRVRVKVIPGADHSFRDPYGEDAVDAVDEFLRRR